MRPLLYGFTIGVALALGFVEIIRRRLLELDEPGTWR